MTLKTIVRVLGIAFVFILVFYLLNRNFNLTGVWRARSVPTKTSPIINRPWPPERVTLGDDGIWQVVGDPISIKTRVPRLSFDTITLNVGLEPSAQTELRAGLRRYNDPSAAIVFTDLAKQEHVDRLGVPVWQMVLPYKSAFVSKGYAEFIIAKTPDSPDPQYRIGSIEVVVRKRPIWVDFWGRVRALLKRR